MLKRKRNFVKRTKKMKKQEVADLKPLIERFEKDIIYDMHSLIARFGRSDAQKKLFRKGKEALRQVTEHLKENPPSDFMNLHIAWAMLLNRFEIKFDKNKTAPQKLDDTEGWIAWAEKFAV